MTREIKYEINGTYVDHSTWKETLGTLEQIDGAAAKEISSDNKITEDEINRILDRNGDSTVTRNDFKGFSQSLFGKAKDVLSKHGFGAYQRLWSAKEADHQALKDVPIEFWKDRDFVLSVVKQNGLALQYASPDLKNDHEIVLEAVKQNGMALGFASQSLKQEKEIVLEALKQTPYALDFVPATLMKERDFVLEAVKQNGMALKYTPSFSDDREIVLEAVKSNGIALEFASERLKNDPQLVLQAAKQDVHALNYASKPLTSDRQFMFEAVRIDGLALEYASGRLINDDELVLTAVRKNPDALLHASEDLKGSYAFLRKAANVNWRILKLETLDQKLRSDVWKNITEDINYSDHFTDEEMKDLNSFTAALDSKYDISFPQRFLTIDTIFKILDMREDGPVADAKNVVIIAPKKDYNSAFATYPLEDRLLELGMNVIYYESEDESDVKRNLDKATAYGEKKVSIIIGGHGAEKVMALGKSELSPESKTTGLPAVEEEKYFIDVSDFIYDDELELSKYIEPGGDLVLDSCSTGEGGAGNPNNLANTVARTVPKGVTIQSSTEPMNIEDVSLTPDGHIKFKWTTDSMYRSEGLADPVVAGLNE